MGTDFKASSKTGRLSAPLAPRPQRTRAWMYIPEPEPGALITPAEIYTLASAITNLDTVPVLTLGRRAAKVGQKQLAIELYRCVVLQNRVRQVAIGQLRYVAEKLNQGAYAS